MLRAVLLVCLLPGGTLHANVFHGSVFGGSVFLSGSQPPAEEVEPTVLGKPADWVVDRNSDDRRRVELPEGTELHEDPWPGSPVVGTAPGGPLELWESRRGWVRVLIGDLIGWANVDPQESPRIDSPEGVVLPEAALRDPRETVPLEIVDQAPPDLVETALVILGDTAKEGTLGPFRLLTDVEAPKLFRILEAVATQLPSVYASVYGLPASEPLDATLVVFDREADYAQLRAAVTDGPTTDVSGFAYGSAAAIHIDGRSRDEISKTLIHEICHILNGTYLRPLVRAADVIAYRQLAPWLEEGIAESLALSYVDRKGTVHSDTLARTALRTGSKLEIWGNSAEFLNLIIRMRGDELVPIDELVRLSRLDFLESPDRSLHYAQSATLVRFMLDQSDLEPLFLRFLSDVSAARTTSHDLMEYLETPQPTLEKRYREWIVETTQRELL